MKREDLEKLSSDPAWKAAFESALEKAEGIHGEGSSDALSYAATAADLATDPKAVANAAAEAAARTQAEHVERLLAAARAVPPSPVNDKQATIQQGWAQAFKTTQIEPERTQSEQSDTDNKPALEAPRLAQERTETETGSVGFGPSSTPNSSGWAKAFARSSDAR